MSLEISIIVPNRVFWKDNAREIILPTLNGQMGVLKDHIPLLTGLDIGLILYRKDNDKKWSAVLVMGGFALVNNNLITILVNEAEFALDIKPSEAENDFNVSKLALDNLSDEKKKLEVYSQFKKSRARLQRSQGFQGWASRVKQHGYTQYMYHGGELMREYIEGYKIVLK